MSPLRIRVTRDVFLADRTLSTVELDLPDDTAGFLPFGFCCEDLDRKVEVNPAWKVPGKTAIPIGIYRVHLYDSPKHGPETPELVGVPGYQHVQIHVGNRPEDTEGCLLFGLRRTATDVTSSRDAMAWLLPRIRDHIHAGGEVTVEVRRAA